MRRWAILATTVLAGLSVAHAETFTVTPLPASTVATNSSVTPTGGNVGITLGTLAADVADVRGFSGIDCTGATKSTGFQSAVTASNGKWLLIPANCTIVTDAIALRQVSYILGQGPTSVIKHIANATDHMLSESNTGATVIFKDITLDGNYQNNGGDDAQTKGTFRMYAGGTSATAPATVVQENVTYINGGVFDESTFYADTAYYTNWFDTNVRHLGGADGYEAGNFDGAVNFFGDGILMDFQRSATSATAIGRAGYIFLLNANNATNYNSIQIVNLQCYNMGVSAAAVLGCVDSYTGGRLFQLTNAASYDGNGRGFSWKPDTIAASLHNVYVYGLHANPNNSSGNVMDAAIGMNSGAGSGYVNVGQDLIMSGIIVAGTSTASNAEGQIVLTFANVLYNPTGLFTNALLENFLIDGCFSTGVEMNDPVNVKIANGLIINCATPISVSTDGVIATGPITITNVDTPGSGKVALASGLTATPNALTGLWYEPGVEGTPLALSDLALTVTSNAVTAWTPVVVVNTGSGAQSVSTISGVPAGKTISVFESSVSHALTLATGGNLGLAAAGSFVMSAANDNMSMRALTIGTPTLIETGRSH